MTLVRLRIGASISEAEGATCRPIGNTSGHDDRLFPQDELRALRDDPLPCHSALWFGPDRGYRKRWHALFGIHVQDRTNPSARRKYKSNVNASQSNKSSAGADNLAASAGEVAELKL